jgi:hypothetical protein
MKRLDFIKSLGALAGVTLAPKSKSEKLTLPSHTSDADHKFVFYTNGVERMRITSSGNVGMGILNPKQILEVTRRVNGGMSSLQYRIK